MTDSQTICYHCRRPIRRGAVAKYGGEPVHAGCIPTHHRK